MSYFYIQPTQARTPLLLEQQLNRPLVCPTGFSIKDQPECPYYSSRFRFINESGRNIENIISEVSSREKSQSLKEAFLQEIERKISQKIEDYIHSCLSIEKTACSPIIKRYQTNTTGRELTQFDLEKAISSELSELNAEDQRKLKLSSNPGEYNFRNKMQEQLAPLIRIKLSPYLLDHSPAMIQETSISMKRKIAHFISDLSRTRQKVSEIDQQIPLLRAQIACNPSNIELNQEIEGLQRNRSAALNEYLRLNEAILESLSDRERPVLSSILSTARFQERTQQPYSFEQGVPLLNDTDYSLLTLDLRKDFADELKSLFAVKEQLMQSPNPDFLNLIGQIKTKDFSTLSTFLCLLKRQPKEVPQFAGYTSPPSQESSNPFFTRMACMSVTQDPSLKAFKYFATGQIQRGLWEIQKINAESAANLTEELKRQLIGDLKDQESTEIRPLSTGANSSFIVKLKSGNQLIFKPFPAKTFYNEKDFDDLDERDNQDAGPFAYWLDQKLGINRVPISFNGSIKGQLGSFQLIIPQASTIQDIDRQTKIGEGIAQLPPSLNSLYYLLGDYDHSAHAGNNMVFKDDTSLIFSIDEGKSHTPHGVNEFAFQLKEMPPVDQVKNFIPQDKQDRMNLIKKLREIKSQAELNRVPVFHQNDHINGFMSEFFKAKVDLLLQLAEGKIDDMYPGYVKAWKQIAEKRKVDLQGSEIVEFLNKHKEDPSRKTSVFHRFIRNLGLKPR